MGKQKEITINTFDRGMSNDPRSSDLLLFLFVYPLVFDYIL